MMEGRRGPLMPGTLLKNGKTHFECLYRGLSIEDFDRTHNLSFWKLARIFQVARACAFAHPEYFTNEIKLYHPDGPMGWTTITVYSISRSFYKKAKEMPFIFLMKMSNKLGKLGNSSMDIISTISDAADGECLGTVKLKYVMVDRITRKGMQIPSDFKKKFEAFSDISLGIPNTNFPESPPDAFSMHHIIRPSDIDGNKHMNNTYYIRLCYDCATLASEKHRSFRNFHGDICNYLAKEVSIHYSGESRLGDELDIFTWEDPVKEFTLHFNIASKSIVIFKGSIEFYKPEDIRSML